MTKKFRKWPLAALVAVLAACGGSDGGPTPPPVPPGATVAVTQTTPANDALRVPVDVKPTVTFTAADAASLTVQASLACDDGNVIATSVSPPAVSGGTVTVTPSRNLPVASVCSLSVTLSALPAGAVSNATAAISFTTAPAGDAFPPKLYTSLNFVDFVVHPPGYDPPEMAIIDLDSGQIQEVNHHPRSLAGTCDFAFNRAIGETQMACPGGFVLADGASTQFPSHNPATNVFSPGARFAAEQAQAGVLAECGDDGRCFYVFSRVAGGATGNRVGIVGRHQDVKAFVEAPDQDRSPVNTVLAGGKLYIQSASYSGPFAETASISRFDLATGRFENFTGGGKLVTIGQRVNGMAVAGEKIFVSVSRTAGKDVLAYDAATGARLPGSDLSLPDSDGLGARGMAASGTTLYVAYDKGVAAFDLATGAVRRAAERFRCGQLALGNGKVYAAYSEMDGRVTGGFVEIDPQALAVTRTFPRSNLDGRRIRVAAPR